ncbi:S-layer homology domain-containing protein [Brevibacillus sp. SYP-B805]|uniref:S-layer homology domain-containing protein n=1 Tax=Brevibacillus sp. SYP-B805 TaxID=1578199 RepID=UPI0013ED2FE8|nr:S-layer homology domain-containing protein [Brevibacillus sp. SYP-B805]NGQ96445.1 S-layer homology domain-containing protein [Brevibacillus sp. SYP-B805]
MLRKLALAVLMLLTAASTVQVNHAEAATYRDLEGHWSKETVAFLSKLGIYWHVKGSFQPDAPISRGEALALLNRIVEAAYGRLGDPYAKTQADYRYPMAGEIRGLVGNINTLYYIYQHRYSDVTPGHDMLYYLHLSATGKKMRDIKPYRANWWLSSNHLNQPLTREEASMLFFHVLSPQIAKKSGFTEADAKDRFTQIYQWKVNSVYIDTPTPFATLIKGYHILEGSGRIFWPYAKVTRAQFALMLKRLYDTYALEKNQLFNGSMESQIEAANTYLTAVSYAWEKRNLKEMARYFSPDVLKKIGTLPKIPLHDYAGVLKISDEDSNHLSIQVSGTYHSYLYGDYEVDYQLKKNPQANNPYEWQVTAVSVRQP